ACGAQDIGRSPRYPATVLCSPPTLTPAPRHASLRVTLWGAADGPLEPSPGRAGRGRGWARAGGGVWAAAWAIPAACLILGVRRYTKAGHHDGVVYMPVGHHGRMKMGRHEGWARA